jgi:hypothetical protein
MDWRPDSPSNVLEFLAEDEEGCNLWRFVNMTLRTRLDYIHFASIREESSVLTMRMAFTEKRVMFSTMIAAFEADVVLVV